jgi:hypothetical protein
MLVAVPVDVHANREPLVASKSFVVAPLVLRPKSPVTVTVNWAVGEWVPSVAVTV